MKKTILYYNQSINLWLRYVVVFLKWRRKRNGRFIHSFVARLAVSIDWCWSSKRFALDYVYQNGQKKASMQKKKKQVERDNSVKGSRYTFSVGWCFSHLDKESKEPTVSVGNSQKKRQVKVTTTWWMAITDRHRAPCVTQLTFFLLFLFAEIEPHSTRNVFRVGTGRG